MRNDRIMKASTIALLAVLVALTGCNKKQEQPPAPTNSAPVMAQAAMTQTDKDAEARKEEIAEAERKAEEERSSLLAIKQHISHSYGSHIKLIRGQRFSADQTVALDWLQELLNRVPKRESVDLVDMYKTIGGFDGSTTSEALAHCQQSFVGKYYMLQGDVFQIQADRDYPRDGKNEFMLFGQVNLPPSMPVNVGATSQEKVPPYTMSPMLTQIVGFDLGKNRRGESIIIPLVKVVVVVSATSFSDDPSEIVISEPTVVARLMRLPAPESEADSENSPPANPSE
jgi:predicted small lipoprotein YifL